MTLYPLDRPLPVSLTATQAVAVYLNENGFTVDEYDLDTVTVTFWGWTFTLPNPKQRKLAIRFHDIHHVVTGYGTDPVGEAEISAWEVRKGISGFGLYVQLIIYTGTILGLLHSPKRIWHAWCAGRGKVKLPPATIQSYEHLLTLTVGELRALYGVPEQGIAGARALNEHAPSRPDDSELAEHP
ncbi:MAG TPA: hypothetical protein DCQ06_02400 [Myxococcales bacterium]|nr:hypothetical protein [Myxococcales bacterium]